MLEHQVQDIERRAILVLEAFTPKGGIQPLGLEIETVTQAEYDRRKEAGEL